jgi:hypothetical protein
MRSASILCLLIAGPVMHAQVLIIVPGSGDPMDLHFNEALVRRNGIFGITGQMSVKRDGEPMRERGERNMYRFDAHGRLAREIRSYGHPGSGLDTTSSFITYDSAGHQVEELRCDLHGWFALRDSLDTLGRSVRRTHVRIVDQASDRYQLQPGPETIISDERSVYSEVNDTCTRRTWLNERGLPYRDEDHRRDHLGYLRSIEHHNLITGRRGTILFRYDAKGRLAERIERPDLAAGDNTRQDLRYDAAGNVTSCDVWRNGRQTLHAEYLYEEGSLLLKAIISKDMETGLIHVMRYTTERP